MKANKTKHYVTFNGKRYDATTGLPITSVIKKVVKDNVATSIDGIKRTESYQTASTKIKVTGDKVKKSVTTKVRAAPKAAQRVHSKAQKSSTLIRTAVKPKKAAKIIARNAPLALRVDPELFTPATDMFQRKIDQIREERAKKAATHQNISHFSSLQTVGQKISTHIANLPVKQAKEIPPIDHEPPITQAHLEHKIVLHEELLPLESEPQPAVKRRHKAAKRLGVNRKVFTSSTTAIALLLIGGLITFLNVPKLSMRYAANEASFTASDPKAIPAGFHTSGPIEYGDKKVRVNYATSNDDRSFQVLQEASNWDSEKLLNEYVIPNYGSYQTYSANGITVYLVGGGNAVWVNNGIRYTITGSAGLSTDQVTAMAAKMH